MGVDGGIGDDEGRFEIEQFSPLGMTLFEDFGERLRVGDVRVQFLVEELEDQFIVTVAATEFAERHSCFVQHAHDGGLRPFAVGHHLSGGQSEIEQRGDVGVVDEGSSRGGDEFVTSRGLEGMAGVR